MQLQVDIAEQAYPGNMEDVDRESNDPELEEEKKAVRVARFHLNTMVNQINILAEKQIRTNIDGSIVDQNN